MQLNGKASKVQTFEEFNAARKRAAESDDAALAAQAEALEHPKVRRQRKPKPAAAAVPPEEASLADLLLQAVRLASTRKGRIPQAVLVREQTLLEILNAALGESNER